LDVLKGKYTFDYMKKSRYNAMHVGDLVERITSGVTEAVLKELKS
jgi:hypothetical protein